MLLHSFSPFLFGSFAFTILSIGYVSIAVSFARAYRFVPLYSANFLYLAFLVLTSFLFFLESVVFLDTYVFSIPLQFHLIFWQFSFFLAIIGISAFQLRFSNLMHRQWKLLYPVGVFAGGLIGTSFSTMVLHDSPNLIHPSFSSKTGEFLVVMFYILLTIPAVIIIAVSRRRYGAQYSEKIEHSSRYELISGIMLFFSSLSFLLPDKLYPHHFFILFVGLSMILVSYSYRQNPFPFRIPIDAKAILFSLYDKQTSREIARVEVSDFSHEVAGLYSLALSGISGILSEITQSREINAMITGKNSHVLVSAKENLIAFMISLGKNSIMPTNSMSLFLHFVVKEGSSQQAIAKYLLEYMAPLFFHGNYDISYPQLLLRNG